MLLLLCWVFTAVQGPSLVVARGGHSLVVVRGLIIMVASLVAEHSFYSMQTHWLWCMDLAASQHVVSSQTTVWIHIPCFARWILTTGRTTRKFSDLSNTQILLYELQIETLQCLCNEFAMKAKLALYDLILLELSSLFVYHCAPHSLQSYWTCLTSSNSQC